MNISFCTLTLQLNAQKLVFNKIILRKPEYARKLEYHCSSFFFNFNEKTSHLAMILVTLTVSFNYKSYVRTLFLMSELGGNAPPSLSHVTWGCGVPVT